jgi:hypothetical protein
MNEVWNEVFDSKQEVVLQGLDPQKFHTCMLLMGLKRINMRINK